MTISYRRVRQDPVDQPLHEVPDGQNLFRILGCARTGWESWNNGYKPVRLSRPRLDCPHHHVRPYLLPAFASAADY